MITWKKHQEWQKREITPAKISQAIIKITADIL